MQSFPETIAQILDDNIVQFQYRTVHDGLFKY